MKNHPVVQNHYQRPGLNGWFGDLLKGVASAAGAMIGGIVGMAVVSLATYAIDRYVNGNEKAKISVLGFTIYGPDSGNRGLNSAYRNDLLNLIDNKDLQNWIKQKFEPYILSLAKTLKGSENLEVLKSEAYRSKINEAIKSLSVAAYYYEVTKGELPKLGLKGIADFDNIEVNSESKATVIYSFLNGFKEAYILALKKEGIKPSVRKEKIQVRNYTGNKVESYIWPSSTTIEIEVFVQPGTGENPTTITEIEIEDFKKQKDISIPKAGEFEVTNTFLPPPNTEETPNPTATVETGKTKNASVFGWGLAALIGGTLMFKKKNKKK